MGTLDRSGKEVFFLYVEGARDGEVLRAWARRIFPGLVRRLEESIVIMGGRRPARAVEHIRAQRSAGRHGRGLVVLDRDHHPTGLGEAASDSALEIFTWKRRHLESYLLVPAAIQRAIGLKNDSLWIERMIQRHLPATNDEDTLRIINAKVLLGPKGALSLATGRRLSAAAIASHMKTEEIHPDVIELYDRIHEGIGIGEQLPEVVHRITRGQERV